MAVGYGGNSLCDCHFLNKRVECDCLIFGIFVDNAIFEYYTETVLPLAHPVQTAER